MSKLHATTGRLAYLKLWTVVTLLRSLVKASVAIGRFFGTVDYEPPHEVIYIKSSTSNRSIRINIYRNRAALSTTGPAAVHMNWHGSAWMLPLLGENAPFIRAILENDTLASYPLVILDCSYALSPEHPCPADTEDARDAYNYVLNNPDNFDASRITCSGFSAGGTVALGLAVGVGSEERTRIGTDSFSHPIKAVMTFYSMVTWVDGFDKVHIPPGKQDWPGTVGSDYILDLMKTAHFFSPTLESSNTEEEERSRIGTLMYSPIVSPANAEAQDFPPLVVMFAPEYDISTRKANELRDKLSRGGQIEVYGNTVLHAGHGWDLDVKEGSKGYKDRVAAYDTCIWAIAKVGGLGT